MQEIGTVQSVSGKTARVLIRRHAACGECGACQVGKEKMTMETTAFNEAGAKPGDEVYVEMRFVNVLTATGIAYGLPLVAFLAGMLIGWYAAAPLGIDQVLCSFLLGLLLTVLVYLGIYVMEKKRAGKVKYQPVITELVPKEPLEGAEGVASHV